MYIYFPVKVNETIAENGVETYHKTIPSFRSRYLMLAFLQSRLLVLSKHICGYVTSSNIIGTLVDLETADSKIEDPEWSILNTAFGDQQNVAENETVNNDKQ